jgi:iron complex outermembrane recepter protein
MNPIDDVELDVGLRFVADLTNPAVPGYTELDARIGWHVTDNLELSVSGFNLLDEHHPEIGAAAGRREVRREVYFSARTTF